MKLNQVIVENLLNAINTAAGPSLAMNQPGAPDGSTVIEIKRLLRKHKLVTGKNADGTYQTVGPAWTGDSTGEWSQALDDAIKTWKRSINIQMDDESLLDANFAELRRKDIEFLQARLFGGSGSTAGLLYKEGSQEQKGKGGPPLQGITIDINTNIDTPTTAIKNTVDMLNAVTPTGWYYILFDLATEKGLEGNVRATEIARMWPVVYERQNQMADVWLENVWKDKVVRSVGERKQATLANGSKMSYVPDMGRGNTASQAQACYRHFKQLGNGLLEKYRDLQREVETASTNTSDAGALNNQPTLDDNAVRVWVRRMDKALNFDFIAMLPFGRPPDDDVEAVADLMKQLASAGDWDKVAEVYQQTFNKNLGARLADELDDGDYNNFVVLRLTNLRRIMPRILLNSVQFGNTEETLDVSVEGATYKLNKELQRGKVEVSLRGKTVKDVLIVDAVLRQAIKDTGGMIPDLNITVSSENRAAAGAVLVSVISDTLPEMTAFYTGQKPFDESPVAVRLGTKRIRDLLQEVGIQIANGADPQGDAIKSFIRQEVLDDRRYLIGDGTEENPGQGVHFDTKYKDESLIKSGFQSSLDDVDGSEEDEDMMNRLQDDSQSIGALREILGATNVEDEYVRLYRLFQGRSNQPLEQRFIQDEDDLMEYMLNNDTSNIAPEFVALMNEISVPFAAPTFMAKLFKDSQSERWAFWGLGTDDELMAELVGRIDTADKFDAVQQRYREKGYGTDIINDIDGEQVGLWSEGSYVERLKEVVGRQRDVNLSRIGLGTALQRAIGNAQEEATVENLTSVKRNITTNEVSSDIGAVEKLLDVIANIVLEQSDAGGVNEEQRDLFLAIVDDIGEVGKELDEDWYNDDFEDWKMNNSDTWFN
jgi:hypothetical protein